MRFLVFILIVSASKWMTGSGIQIDIKPEIVVLGTSSESPQNTYINCSVVSLNVNTIYNIIISRQLSNETSITNVAIGRPGGTPTFLPSAPTDITDRNSSLTSYFSPTTPVDSYMTLVLKTEYMTCYDDGHYQCRLTFDDYNFIVTAVDNTMALSTYALPSGIEINVLNEGTGPSNGFYVGEVVQLACHGNIGSSTATKLQWKRTVVYGNNDIFQKFTPLPGTSDDGIASDVLVNCSYTRTASLHYNITKADLNRNNNLAFKCYVETSITSDGEQTSYVENSNKVFIKTEIDSCASNPCLYGNCSNNANNYTCVCDAGYAGMNCDADINECLSNPCINGTCINGVNGYMCFCDDGFTGNTCEIELNECVSNPCIFGFCTDHINTFNCTCFAGYTGVRCETNIDECVSSPCNNNGTCVDNIDGYTCYCQHGYNGTYCDEDINECLPDPCDHGVCTDLVGGYTCTCDKGYTGVNCSTEINECYSSPCYNGSCTDIVNGYICTCSQGYTGSRCEIDIDECSSSPCFYGTCIDISNGYTCTCFEGFTGSTCDTDIDECLSNPCYQGTCTDVVGGYLCSCDSGYTGVHCDIDMNECSSSPCAHGSCSDRVNGYLCTCHPGYTGVHCESDINECLSNPCVNGVCVNGANNYTCICNVGYTGYRCDQDIDECLSSPCINGTCIDGINGHTCTCSEGFTGSTCDTDIDKCQSNPCYQGTCSNMVDGYFCSCVSGYTGVHCDIDINECSSNPCLHGSCSDRANGYLCTCHPGYTGVHCDLDINECLSNPCVNGVCINGVNNYTCSCSVGYTGYRCDQDINECLSSPCHRHAVCYNYESGYACMCKPGFTGNGFQCTDLDDCASDPCQNAATCFNTAGSYVCFCRSGWTGSRCETDINECTSSSACVTNADCTNSAGSYMCTCSNGYVGDGRTECKQEVLLSNPSGSYYYRGDNEMFGPFYFARGIAYNGKKYYYAYVSINEYMTLGRYYRSTNPITSANSWRSIRYPIIAPLWSNIDMWGTYGDAGIYINSITGSSDLKKIKDAFGDNSFDPRYSFMVTWKKAVPYPYYYNYRYEYADFQAIIASDGSTTKLMFNYDQQSFTWRSWGRSVVVGFSKSNFVGDIKFNRYNYQNVNKGSNVGLNGRWVYDVSQSSNPAEARCYNWYLDYSKQYQIRLAKRYSDPCPCTRRQARRDNRYRYYGYYGGVYRYRSRFYRWPYYSRQQCHYRYSWGGLERSYPPRGGYMETYYYSLGIQQAYQDCCVSSHLCSLFYARNPPQTCRGYRPPTWGQSTGDPHITTLDGMNYTFNGRGEYMLFQIKAENTSATVQVRTELVKENDPDATVFVGLAAKEGEDAVIEVVLDRTKNESTIYINGNIDCTFSSANPSYVNIETNGTSVYNDTDKLNIAFESGLSIQIGVTNILDIVVAAPEEGEYVGNTRGLLGNNDGDSENDFELRNGSMLRQNSTEAELFDFGISWQVHENESLFNYTNGGHDYNYYNNDTIRPRVFLSDIIGNLSQYLADNCPEGGITVDEITETCDGNTACIIDTAGTCSTAFGMASKLTEETIEGEAAILDNFPPSFTAPDVIHVGYSENTSVTLDMDVYVTDTDLDTISLNTSIPQMEYTFVNKYFSWNVTSSLRDFNTSIYIKFTANDTTGATSEYWPDVQYCGCEDVEQCDFSLIYEDNDNEDHFYHSRCNCSEDTDGEFCEQDVDVCEPNPCYENVTCNSATPDNLCGPCPEGLSGDGETCFDVDECYDNETCSQNCTNQQGDYECTCYVGYEMNSDTSDCADIDECLSVNQHTCESNTECMNTEGSYKCTCMDGYARSESDVCVDAPVTIEVSINVKADAMFLNYSEKVVKSVKSMVETIFNESAVQLVAIGVTKNTLNTGVKTDRVASITKDTQYNYTVTAHSKAGDITPASVQETIDTYIVNNEGDTLVFGEIPLTLSNGSLQLIKVVNSGMLETTSTMAPTTTDNAKSTDSSTMESSTVGDDTIGSTTASVNPDTTSSTIIMTSTVDDVTTVTTTSKPSNNADMLTTVLAVTISLGVILLVVIIIFVVAYNRRHKGCVKFNSNGLVTPPHTPGPQKRPYIPATAGETDTYRYQIPRPTLNQYDNEGYNKI